MIKHVNNGKCPKCALIFDKYKGFHPGLRAWFEGVQLAHPEAHVSSAGRGKLEQELFFKQGSSRAKYGQSAHNYNAAIDIFKLHMNGAEWPKPWFTDVVGAAVKKLNENPSDFKLKWYGEPGSKFYELPHVEIKDWASLPLPLVEPLAVIA